MTAASNESSSDSEMTPADSRTSDSGMVDSETLACPQGMTLPQWIQQRAWLHPHRPAVTFVPDDAHGEASDATVSQAALSQAALSQPDLSQPDLSQPDLQCCTYQQLWQNSHAVAGELVRRLGGFEGEPDDAPRVLLLYPAGTQFLFAFLGAQIAGYIPVPTCYPKPHREMPRLNSAAEDCDPICILTDAATQETLALEKLPQGYQTLPTISTNQILGTGESAGSEKASSVLSGMATHPDAIAFLQYTSGSTSEPKGVAVRHRNVISNLESIRQAFRAEWPDHSGSKDSSEIEVCVSWLPFYHDMGLIGGILEPLYIGGHTILTSPRAFLQRPIRWLQMISDHKATVTGAPNFAYQLCIDRIPPAQTDSLDLSALRVSFCGAEPIAPRTLRDFHRRFASNGFTAGAFYPCYGLAEATLLVTGGDGPAEPKVLSVEREAFESGCIQVLDPQQVAKTSRRKRQDLVSCGRAVPNTEIAIIDPNSQSLLREDAIGEIWVRGGGVSTGYWKDRDASRSPVAKEEPCKVEVGPAGRFDATIAGQPDSGFFRTGDLGFLHEGELYVTGRLKDLIILRGRNLFPADIEFTVAECVRERFSSSTAPDAKPMASGLAAAFPIKTAHSEALGIVAELPRQTEGVDLVGLSRQIRRSVIEIHEVDPQSIWLLRSASIPVTTSGKVRRSECKKMFREESFNVKHRYDRSSFSEQGPIPFPVLPAHPTASDAPQLKKIIESWMAEWLVARAGVTPMEVSVDTPFTEYGLDSMTAVELSGETEDWTGVTMTPDVAWENPTIASLSKYIAEEYAAMVSRPA